MVAQNFGDVRAEILRIYTVTTLAARIKQNLKIRNPSCVAYDLPFGCPGWLQAVIQVDYFLRSGDAKRALVIGTETLSRVSDPVRLALRRQGPRRRRAGYRALCSATGVPGPR